MTDTLIGDVSDTAFWIAHHRSVETQRPDALFRDPLAGVLAGDRGKNIADAMPRSFMTAWAIVMRTCIIDDHIRLAIAEGADAVLNLGAGLDTRPYRMDLPASFTWTEADYPHIIDYKEKTLAQEIPRCQLKRVQCDLANATDRQQVWPTPTPAPRSSWCSPKASFPISASKTPDRSPMTPRSSIAQNTGWSITSTSSATQISPTAHAGKNAECAIQVRARRLARIFQKPRLALQGGTLSRRRSRPPGAGNSNASACAADHQHAMGFYVKCAAGKFQKIRGLHAA